MATIQGTLGNDPLFGASGDDIVLALSGNDTVFGGNGNDQIFLGDGNDAANGGIGDDTLVGGTGVDSMSGSFGRDRYVFQSTADSGVGVGNRDIVTLERGFDKIDLSLIDANTNLAGNQAFTFVGSTTNAGAGQVGFFVSSVTGHVVLTLDVNGGADEMQIELDGTSAVSAADILL